MSSGECYTVDMTTTENRNELAEFLHERFAPDYVGHWSELDEQEQGESEYADMADAIVAEFTLSRKGPIMTTTRIPPVVSTRIDISDQPATQADLLAAFEAVTEAIYRLNSARYNQFGTELERVEYKDASKAELAAYAAMLDVIYKVPA